MGAADHMKALGPLLAALALAAGSAQAAEPPLAALTVIGPPETVFSRAKDACDGHDVPDTAARAFRDARGHIVLFAFHYENRAMRGPGFDALKMDCRVVLGSGDNPDPARYDDKSWITATWTEDGAKVAALIHHEFQANHHPGRCRFTTYMPCWSNAVLGITSPDAGASFPRPKTPQVVATSPFRQDFDQGRHRGFFNPSNIFADGPYRYMFSSTTGWDGQPYGACLFRTTNPLDHDSWRAFDGKEFSIRYADPYRAKEGKPPRSCQTIAPFPAPVGSVVRHRGSGAWLAVFQASAGGRFPEAGFYAASSRDLITWSEPRLLVAGKTLYDDPCTSGGRLIAYPALIDRDAKGRNFDDVGDSAELYFSTIRVEGCQTTSDRDLIRRKVAIKVWP
jgi:hypothetical protein